MSEGVDDRLETLRNSLQALGTLEYERERKSLSERYGIRVAVLDRERKEMLGGREGFQGKDLFLSDPEPWPHEVVGQEVFAEVKGLLRRHLVLSEGGLTTMALWIGLTHAPDNCYVLPMLVFSSAAKRSGKSTAMECVARLARRPLSTSNISVAALFRSVEKFAPTLLIDEADSVFHQNDDLRTLVNGSFTKNAAFVIRCVGEDQEPRAFSTWCPKALALIGKLPSTLSDRAFVVRLKRKGPGETIQRMRADNWEEFTAVQRKVARFMASAQLKIAGSEPWIPLELNDRAADSWRELLKIAEILGPPWIEDAHRAAIELSLQAELDEEDERIMLLADIREFLRRCEMKARFSSTELLNHLLALEERPWNEWKQGKPLSARSLASVLADFGIRSKASKVSGHTLRCYETSDFVEVFRCYLPEEANLQTASLTDYQKRESKGFREVAVVERNAEPLEFW